MITPNPPSPEPPPDDANRPRPPPDARISETPPLPLPESAPFPVDEPPFHHRRPDDRGARTRRLYLMISILAIAACFGGCIYFMVGCSLMGW